jgi:hypothetical protein
MSETNWDQIIADLERLTAPAGNWSIQWNDHRSSYMTVKDWLAAIDAVDQFASPAECQRAIDENRMVTLHWYNRTPVGSYKISAPDMAGLLIAAAHLIKEVADVRD